MSVPWLVFFVLFFGTTASQNCPVPTSAASDVGSGTVQSKCNAGWTAYSTCLNPAMNNITQAKAQSMAEFEKLGCQIPQEYYAYTYDSQLMQQIMDLPSYVQRMGVRLPQRNLKITSQPVVAKAKINVNTQQVLQKIVPTASRYRRSAQQLDDLLSLHPLNRVARDDNTHLLLNAEVNDLVHTLRRQLRSTPSTANDLNAMLSAVGVAPGLSKDLSAFLASVLDGIGANTGTDILGVLQSINIPGLMDSARGSDIQSTLDNIDLERLSNSMVDLISGAMGGSFTGTGQPLGYAASMGVPLVDQLDQLSALSLSLVSMIYDLTLDFYMGNTPPGEKMQRVVDALSQSFNNVMQAMGVNAKFGMRAPADAEATDAVYVQGEDDYFHSTDLDLIDNMLHKLYTTNELDRSLDSMLDLYAVAATKPRAAEDPWYQEFSAIFDEAGVDSVDGYQELFDTQDPKFVMVEEEVYDPNYTYDYFYTYPEQLDYVVEYDDKITASVSTVKPKLGCGFCMRRVRCCKDKYMNSLDQQLDSAVCEEHSAACEVPPLPDKTCNFAATIPALPWERNRNVIAQQPLLKGLYDSMQRQFEGLVGASRPNVTCKMFAKLCYCCCGSYNPELTPDGLVVCRGLKEYSNYKPSAQNPVAASPINATNVTGTVTPSSAPTSTRPPGTPSTGNTTQLPPVCNANEELNACGPKSCESRCAAAGATPATCANQCIVSAQTCVCKNGFSRSFGGLCVQSSNCTAPCSVQQNFTCTNQTSPSCSKFYQVNATVLNSGQVRFTVWTTATAGMWAAIGFNNASMMPGADIVAAQVFQNGTVTVTDWKAIARSSPLLDAQQDIQNATTQYVNGTLNSFTFLRSINTGDPNDVDLSECVYLLYPYSGGMIDSAGTLMKHTITPAIPLNKVCFKC